jgi:hypothetical protein
MKALGIFAPRLIASVVDSRHQVIANQNVRLTQPVKEWSLSAMAPKRSCTHLRIEEAIGKIVICSNCRDDEPAYPCVKAIRVWRGSISEYHS